MFMRYKLTARQWAAIGGLEILFGLVMEVAFAISNKLPLGTGAIPILAGVVCLSIGTYEWATNR